VLERPDNEPAGPMTVCPGLHAFPDGYQVVWWDPSALELGAAPPFGVRRDDLIVKDVARNVVADGRSRYDRWRLARLDARASGSEPSLKVETVSEWTADPSRQLPAAAGEAIVRLDEAVRRDPDERFGGPTFGILVHAVLAQAGFDATREALEDIACGEARVIGIDEPAARAAAARAERVLGHPLLKRARSAAARGACRRETPISCRLPDGVLVEGVVDLAFEEDGRWTVVDYKTDREIAEGGEERYRRQIALYAAAIGQATGAPASGVLLRI
jgi:ATP-dependent exoDNAse (exonuclease V) beta subunit